MEEKLTISVREMAEKLGISYTKAYEMTSQEGFPKVNISDKNGKFLIPLAELNEYLAQQTINGVAQNEKSSVLLAQLRKITVDDGCVVMVTNLPKYFGVSKSTIYTSLREAYIKIYKDFPIKGSPLKESVVNTLDLWKLHEANWFPKYIKLLKLREAIFGKLFKYPSTSTLRSGISLELFKSQYAEKLGLTEQDVEDLVYCGLIPTIHKNGTITVPTFFTNYVCDIKIPHPSDQLNSKIARQEPLDRIVQ